MSFMIPLLLLAATPDYASNSLTDAMQEKLAVELMDSLRCMVCQGQPISGSDAELAGDMRRLVRQKIAAGESANSVRAYLISRYGEQISFNPAVSAHSAPLWLVPLFALLGGLVLVSRRLRTRRR